MKVTIKKIAEEAGVSITTVSNVINNKAHRVSENKRELIEGIIEKYNYSPNMNARALVRSSSRLIGLLYFSQTPQLDFTDPFVAEVLEGIERITKPNGFFTLVHKVTSQKDIENIQKNWRFDGFIAVGFSQSLFEKINQSIQVPIIFIDTHLDERIYSNITEYPNRYFVNTDDFTAAFLATDYLIENGHKKIAFLSYDFDINQTSVVQQRYIGYLSALKKKNLIVSDSLLYTHNDFDEMLANFGDYSAVLITADYLAIRFLYFLKENQVNYEEELSVIGFDDIKYAEFNDPPLTTVKLDQLKKGMLAMQMLADIVDKGKKVPQLTNLSGELKIRETVKKNKRIK
ncbi:LacI family DNA-binding transcriptional regulator [Enterococcus songbeiensis]